MDRYSASICETVNPDNYVLHEGDLIVTMTDLSVSGDTLGYSALVPGGDIYLHNQRIGKVIIKSDQIDKMYLYYLLRTRDYQQYIVATSTGTAIHHTSPSTIKSYKFKLIPIDSQRKIASILFNLEALMNYNQLINDNLMRTCREYYHKVVVNSSTTILLSDLAEVCYGKDHKHLKDGSYPVYGSGGIMRYCEKPLYQGKESVLIPRKGSLNNVLFVSKPFWSVDTMFYTKMRKSFDGKYLYFWLTELNLADMNSGSAVPSMTTDILNDIEI